MPPGFVLVQRHGQAAQDDGAAAGAQFVGEREAARELAGEHHGDADDVGVALEVYGPDVLVGHGDVDAVREAGRGLDGTERREIEPGLMRELRPGRVDEMDVHAASSPGGVCGASRRIVKPIRRPGKHLAPRPTAC